MLRPISPKPPRCGRCGCGPDLAKFGPVRRRCIACLALDKAERVARKPPVPRRARHASGSDPAYMAWVRTLRCAAAPCAATEMQAHHVRLGTGGGTGMKPADQWCIPLCFRHHGELHQRGQRTFEATHHVDLRALAEQLQRKFPACVGKSL